jgi:U6 snRNA-associated Sm-like protein LSm3
VSIFHSLPASYSLRAFISIYLSSLVLPLLTVLFVCLCFRSLSASQTVEVPLDLVRLSLSDRVQVKCRFGRELRGILHAFDEHLNLVLSQVEETATTVEVQPETGEELVKQQRRTIPLLFVRGDAIILVAPAESSKAAS